MEDLYKVKIIEQFQISPPLGSVPQTSLSLTFFDLRQLRNPPSLTRLFYYEIPCLTKSHFMISILPDLKHSLSLTLQYFFSLAGNLIWSPECSKPEILYVEGDSVSLSVAELTDFNFNDVCGNNFRDIDMLLALMPRLLSKSDAILPQLALQVTLFPNSGICIGVTVSHAAVDAKSFSHFVKFWASVCKLGGDTSFISTGPSSVLPVYDRTMFKDPNGIQTFLEKNKITRQCLMVHRNHHKIPTDLVQATFLIGQPEIEGLKRCILTRILEKDTQLKEASFNLSSFVWNAGIALTRFTQKLFRKLLVPCLTSANKEDLLGKDGIVVAAEVIGKGIQMSIKGVSEGFQGDLAKCSTTALEHVSGIGGSPKWKFYETDFGWGRPKNVELCSTHHTKGNTMKEKLPPTTSNRRKIELDRADPEHPDFENLKRSGADTIYDIEDGSEAQVSVGSEIQSESTQAALGAPNTRDGDNYEGEGAVNNKDVGPIDNSLLRSFKFHRAKLIALGQEKSCLRIHHHPSSWDLTRKPEMVRNCLISIFVERWQPKTNSFHFKWGVKTPTLDNREQLIGLGANGDATVIGEVEGIGIKKDEKGQRIQEGSAVCTEGYLEWLDTVSWTRIYPINIDLATDDDVGLFRIHQQKETSVNEERSSPIDQCEDVGEQYDASSKENESLKVDIGQCLLMEQLDLQLPPATPLVIVSSHHPMLDLNLANKTSIAHLLHVFETDTKLDIQRKKLLNVEERKKTLEVDNNEWEVWSQSLKKALASEGMGDMGDQTFKFFLNQNERFFIIAQQGPKGDYQEVLVSTRVTLENVIMARRENMSKRKKLEEVLFQPWVKYLLDVCGVDVDDNNSYFRVSAMIKHQSQHRFQDVMKTLKSFSTKDPSF
ncbi:hypothetical protein GIB67_005973 [Kingdonia uniflora]|uniref:Aminotransferase-like plant mobile domain-containing protein n=1 Tax=Kingdonia uniflora TaxID=39325 RepID=A0A7J7MBT3_9MAGN|nr:hypothetical protein GIB67_005973 [Kingdonia uniflora]